MWRDGDSSAMTIPGGNETCETIVRYSSLMFYKEL